MKVLQVSSTDVIGGRFNGFDLQHALNRANVPTTMYVMEKTSKDDHVKLLIDMPNEGFIQQQIKTFEFNVGLHGMSYPYLWRLQEQKDYQKADVAHYHLLHNYMGSYPVLAEMASKKPSVLTIHDAFLFTGHCVQPMYCNQWQQGCLNCEQLDVHFKLPWDNAFRVLGVKRSALWNSNIHYVVGSRLMERMARENLVVNPDEEHLHFIPFGIDENLFTPDQPRAEIRASYGIPKENFVLFFRSDPTIYKGFFGIQNMLRQWKPSRPVTLIGVGCQGMMREFEDHFQVIDLEWLTDEKKLAGLYCACDMFLMPSIGEAFGMMAIEAMSTERPVLVCDGTALPDVTFAPQCGISIPRDDPKAMSDAIEHQMANPTERIARGKAGRNIVLEHYRFSQYVQRHIALYERLTDVKYRMMQARTS